MRSENSESNELMNLKVHICYVRFWYKVSLPTKKILDCFWPLWWRCCSCHNNVMYCNYYYITSSTAPTIITCIFFLVLYNVVLYSLPGIFPLVGFFIKRNLKMKNPNVALCLFLCHGLHCKLKPERVYIKHNIVFDFLLPFRPFLLLFCFSISFSF